MLASYKIYVKVSTKVKLGDRGGCSGDKSGVSLDRVSEGGGGGVRGWGVNVVQTFHFYFPAFTCSLTHSLVTMM